MTTQRSDPSGADIDAAWLLLARLGVSPADLLAVAEDRAPAPTFAEYIPVVRAAVAEGTRRVYGVLLEPDHGALGHSAVRRTHAVRG